MAKDKSQPKSQVKQSPKKLRGKKEWKEERKIIFSKRFKKYKFMNSDTESKDDADYDAAISQVSDFFEYMRKNRKSVPDEERIANKDKFIKTVEELSNTYKIDVDLEEFSEGYVAHI